MEKSMAVSAHVSLNANQTCNVTGIESSHPRSVVILSGGQEVWAALTSHGPPLMDVLFHSVSLASVPHVFPFLSPS